MITFNISANAELVYGVSDQLNELITFDSATPGTLQFAHSIIGLQTGEQLRGIDWVSGTLYGLGDQNHLYTVNPNTAAVTMVGSFTPPLNGIDFGFNSSGSLFYVSGDLGQNMTLTTGAVGTAGPNYTAGSSIDALAYDHVSSAFYGVSALSHNLLSLNPVTGAVSTVGPTGISFADRIGFDISPNTDIAYFSGTVGGQTEFGTLDKSTGVFSLIGDIGTPGEFTSGLDSIAVASVPEPGTVALLAIGGLLAGLLRRKN